MKQKEKKINKNTTLEGLNIRKAILILAFISSSFVVQAQDYDLNKLTFPQLEDSVEVIPKPIVIKIYTDWCVYCKLQDKQILKSDSLKELLNRNFYYLELNAEMEETLLFNNVKYDFKPNGLSGGVHTLAETLGSENGELSYPILVVLDSSYRILYRFKGLTSEKDLLRVLKELVTNTRN